MQFAAEKISSLFETICQLVLGLSVECMETVDSELPHDQTLMGCIHISGEWNGALVLQCPLPLARSMTKAMLSLGNEPATAEQTQDVLGEITNTVGGNVKALLPGPSVLSLPAVVEGNDYSLRVPGTLSITRLTFRCLDQPVVLTLLESERALTSELSASIDS